ncbi:MAG: carbohydrate-binding domain-containing protein [Clostridia bacterium]|nr:carbohydrate-binding domain-containing protein [Clostridia bacterium]
MKRIVVFLILMLTFLLCSCNNETPNNEINTDFAKTDEEMFTNKDLTNDIEEASIIEIRLLGDSILCDHQGVKIDGRCATIKDSGIYLISGNLENGSLIVDGDNIKPHLILSDVTIEGGTLAPIYIKSCNKTFITLKEETSNRLSTSGEFVQVDDNNVDSVIYAKDDVTINGTGKLIVDSPNGHGIVAKDDLVISSGNIEINALNHGIDANNSVRLATPKLSIVSGKDGIHTENEDENYGYIYMSQPIIEVIAQGDGVSASGLIQIKNGKIKINSTKGELTDSYKGIKSGSTLIIEGGTLEIESYDDCLHSVNMIIATVEATLETMDDGLHADEKMEINGGKIEIINSYEGIEGLNITINSGEINLIASDDGINSAGGNDNSGFGGGFGNDNFGRPGSRPGGMGGGMGTTSSNGSIVINGGTIYIQASGDGIDSNGYLEINGGIVTVCGPTRGDTAVLDYDTTGTINGGSFVGTGSSMMAQTLTSTNHGIISLSVGTRSSGEVIMITDDSGNELLNYTPQLDYAIFIVSIPELVKGESYTVRIGSSEGVFKAQ